MGSIVVYQQSTPSHGAPPDKLGYHRLSAGEAFSPTGSPVGWWPADGITGLVDDDPVGTWPDQSGNGYDLTQATAGNKPTYKTTILNTKPSVRFDGTSDVMQVDGGTGYSNANVTLQGVVDLDYTGNHARGIWFGMTATVDDAITYKYFEAHVYRDLSRMYVFFGDGTNYDYDYFTYTPGNAEIHTLDRDGTGVNVHYWINTAAQSFASSTDFDLSGSPDTFVTGARSTGEAINNWIEGDVFELIFYDSTLSNADRDLNEAGLNTKYAVY